VWTLLLACAPSALDLPAAEVPARPAPAPSGAIPLAGGPLAVRYTLPPTARPGGAPAPDVLTLQGPFTFVEDKKKAAVWAVPLPVAPDLLPTASRGTHTFGSTPPPGFVVTGPDGEVPFEWRGKKRGTWGFDPRRLFVGGRVRRRPAGGQRLHGHVPQGHRRRAVDEPRHRRAGRRGVRRPHVHRGRRLAPRLVPAGARPRRGRPRRARGRRARVRARARPRRAEHRRALGRGHGGGHPHRRRRRDRAVAHAGHRRALRARAGRPAAVGGARGDAGGGDGARRRQRARLRPARGPGRVPEPRAPPEGGDGVRRHLAARSPRVHGLHGAGHVPRTSTGGPHTRRCSRRRARWRRGRCPRRRRR
jgi:hypothetical protein